MNYWQITKYERTDKDGDIVTIEFRGHGKWAVIRFGQCLGTDGDWHYEHLPSSRDESFLELCRFDNMVKAFDAASEAIDFS